MYPVLIGAVFLLSLGILAASPKDTLTYTTPEIKVRSTGILSNSPVSFSSGTFISDETIDKFTAPETADILKAVPGLSLKDYGGMGAMKTLSLRGTNSRQSLILLDGMPLNSSQSGTADLSLIPAGLIKAAEVIRGGNSALFGSNAIGGIVNLRTFSAAANKTSYTAEAAAGQYGFQRVMLSSDIPAAGITLNGFFEYNHSDGNFPITLNEFGSERTLERSNADNSSLNYSLAVAGETDSWHFVSRILAKHIDRGIPGAVIQGNVESKSSRWKSDEGIILAKAITNIAESQSLELSSMLKLNSSLFRDSDSYAGLTDKESKFLGSDILLNGRYNLEWDKGTLNFLTELSRSSLEGDNLETASSISRAGAALAISFENTLFESDFTTLSVLEAVRADFLQEHSPSYTFISGIKSSFTPWNLLWHANISKNFRVPSFNEMYYLNYGNASLLPEKSYSASSGLLWNQVELISLQADAFLILTENQIVAVPKSPAAWSAQNIGEVFTRGIELQLISSPIEEYLTVTIGYTLQQAKDNSSESLNRGKEIVYVPKEILSADCSMFYEGFAASVRFFHSSFMWSLPDNSINSVIPSYSATDINLSYEFEISRTKAKVSFEIKNAGDARYYVIKNYPMPGRMMLGGLKIEI